ncbi:MAG TPA: hypothetical protein VGC42_15865 [Kofleriaceae bacterium]
MFSLLLGAAPVALIQPAAAQAKKPAAAPSGKTAAAKPKKLTPMSADHKKAALALQGGFKFGMSKDEVIATFAKQLDERYDEKIKATTDIAEQDRLRRDKKAEVTRLQQSYVTFEPTKSSPWDVSIVEGEFGHSTGESMLERWENQGGKNQRRFFFFSDGKLWKMFLSLDMSILSEDNKNFAAFEQSMTNAYGPGDASVETGTITWRTEDFELRAVDKLKTYDALGMVIADARVQREVLATREAKAPPPHQANTMINGVIDKDKTDHPDTKANSNAVDAVIKAQGGTPPKR